MMGTTGEDRYAAAERSEESARLNARSKSPSLVRSKLLAILQDKNEFLKSAKRSFQQFDKDQSEALEYDEVLQLVTRLCTNLTLPPIDESILRHIFKKYDTEQDGHLTLEEFIQFYWRLLWRVQEKYYPSRDVGVRRELFVGRHPLPAGHGINEIFDFERRIGGGSFGEVYLVREKNCPDLVRVCKVINKSQAAVPLDQIEAEINVLKKLDHPNVIKIYDVYEDELCVYIIMEYCRGGELLKSILDLSQQGQVMSEEYTACIMYQIFKALSYFHHKNVVHKDLKPENILYHDATNPVATVKVIDFGLAEIFHTTRRHRDSCPVAARDAVSQSPVSGLLELAAPKDPPPECTCGGGESVYSHNAAGTVLYMAPEVFQRRLHLKCDIWSAGCLMYLMLTGHLPYSGKSVGEIRAKVLANLEPKYFRADFLSADCVDLMRKCLDKNVKARPCANAVLNHPWFCGKVYSLGRLPLKYLKNFKKISRVTDIKLCILNLVAHQLDLTNQQVQEISRLFITLDRDHDGSLSVGELRRALVMPEAGPVEDATTIICPWEFNRIFQILDVDNDGQVSYTEFLAAAYSWTQAEINLVWTAFNKLDGSSHGKLGVDHLVAVLSTSDRSADRLRVLKNSVRRLDTNDDGYIDWQEFVDYIRSGGGDRRRNGNS